MSVHRSAVLLHRALWLVFITQAILSPFVDLPYDYWLGWLPGLAAIALGFRLRAIEERRVRAGAPAPVETEPPVTGRWSAQNSPADRVPSHGTHSRGQTYAIDIVAESDERPRPPFSPLWPIARRNGAFPAFGAELRAVADATVVHACDHRRDHLSRTSWPGLIYMLIVEGVVRGVAGRGQIFGNHLVLDLGDGTYAAYAHVQRGSLQVREGDRVYAGQAVARCGNSGNSSEPHVHFQLMDGPDLDRARGIPFTWRGIGVPKNGETFTADPAVPETSA
ncbi:M23 family metallopeptidase [Streptomyces sp. NPDC057445]|uniref:M23 family metallopeptidase n=1 Tax=Streptomyces sp. NPDC057445 TaxID=3346136 RepID=UPI00369B00AF